MSANSVRSHWSVALKDLGACSAAVVWVRTQPDPETAWAACDRADWLLWIAARLCESEAQRKKLVLAACACARTSLRHVPADELRPRRCLEVTEAWCRGEATIAQVRAARRAANDARCAPMPRAAYAAVYAAAAAVYAAGVVAVDAAYAEDDADAAAAAAVVAAYVDEACADAARSAKLRDMAVLVRSMLPMPRAPGAASASRRAKASQ